MIDVPMIDPVIDPAAVATAPAPTFLPEAAKAAEPVVSVIVVSYNTRAMTIDCIASVLEQTSVPYELIVLDNASPDGSAAAIAGAFPPESGVRLIASPENLGFARGNNVAAREATGDYILLLNPDTLVLDHAIDRLVAFAGRVPEAGIWGGRTLYDDGSLNPFSCWGRMTAWSLTCRLLGLTAIFRSSEFFNPEVYGAWPRDSEREVDIVTGCLFLIARETWDRLGGFDPAFVMYGEEVDLCLRARAAGLRPAITPEATIIHYRGASEKVRSDKMVRLLRSKSEESHRSGG